MQVRLMELCIAHPGTTAMCSCTSGSGKVGVFSSTPRHLSEDSRETVGSSHKAVTRTNREIRRQKIIVETVKNASASHSVSDPSEPVSTNCKMKGSKGVPCLQLLCEPCQEKRPVMLLGLRAFLS